MYNSVYITFKTVLKYVYINADTLILLCAQTLTHRQKTLKKSEATVNMTG